jgi:hypothetical protein
MGKNSFVNVAVTLLTCLLTFLLGWKLGSRNVITYSVNGWQTTINRSWPTYGLQLEEDAAILRMLHSGHSEGAVHYVEAMLDLAVRDAEKRRPLLQEDSRRTLDAALTKVAKYRAEFPRPINIVTNDLGDPSQQKQYLMWVLDQKQIDEFLKSFQNTNSTDLNSTRQSQHHN